MRELTQEYLKSVLHYDPVTGIFTWLVQKSQGTKVGSVAGKINEDGYRKIKIDGKMYSAHRLAVFYMRGEWPVNQTDHENVNPDDNRWDNIRDATSSQNQANKRVYKNNKLGLKGVTLHSCGKFQATIQVDGKYKYLGLHDTADLAAAAYAKAANDHFGEFARSA